MDAWDKRTANYVKHGGIEQFWVMDTHDDVTNPTHVDQQTLLRAAKEAPGAIIPFARIRWQDGAEQVEAYFRAGFVGLKAITPPWPYHDARYHGIYEAANRFGMPILFHTGIIGHSLSGPRYPELVGYGPANMQPAFLAAIADLFPNLIIIGGHLGYPYTEQTEHNLYYYPNIYHDMSGYLPLEWLLAVLGKATCRYRPGPRFFYEKILFATDQFIGDPRKEKFGTGKREAFASMIEYLLYGHAWKEYADCTFYQNARRLMDGVLARQKKTRGSRRAR